MSFSDDFELAIRNFRDDAMRTLLNDVSRLEQEIRKNSDVHGIDVIRHLAEISSDIEKVRVESLARLMQQLSEVRRVSAEKIASIEEQSTLTLELSGSTTPAEFAELLMALDTLHREFVGYPLQTLVAKIGLPEEESATHPVG